MTDSHSKLWASWERTPELLVERQISEPDSSSHNPESQLLGIESRKLHFQIRLIWGRFVVAVHLLSWSNSVWPHGLQRIRIPCPSLSPRVCSDSCSLNWWCHPTTKSSVTLFSSSPQFFPASGSFSMSHFLISSGQSIGASASVLPMNTQDWFSLGLTGFISSLRRDSQESSPAQQFKGIDSLVLSLLYGPTLISIHDYWKTVALTIWTFISKVMSLIFNMLSRFVIAFLPWSKQLLISELQSTSTGQLKSYQFFGKLDFFHPVFSFLEISPGWYI